MSTRKLSALASTTIPRTVSSTPSPLITNHSSGATPLLA
ncbi:hypothetical protein T12_12472 [Trichinella patagoniensis]|uniref:Uncharacterized protein n=1 Tax=Trichinella patagoniensis TaxID=990121 RepID=A0A0V0XDX1_9BILA|nr:hypothetical protein T12_12472 [Trichinella patagoniensis]